MEAAGAVRDAVALEGARPVCTEGGMITAGAFGARSQSVAALSFVQFWDELLRVDEAIAEAEVHVTISPGLEAHGHKQ